nr:MAG TPA: hypothetical protein [Caudoviricetes sp.]
MFKCGLNPAFNLIYKAVYCKIYLMYILSFIYLYI